METLVSAARSAGLYYELRNTLDGDLSFDLNSEWHRWGKNEERKRYCYTRIF